MHILHVLGRTKQLIPPNALTQAQEIESVSTNLHISQARETGGAGNNEKLTTEPSLNLLKGNCRAGTWFSGRARAKDT